MLIKPTTLIDPKLKSLFFMLALSMAGCGCYLHSDTSRVGAFA